MIYKYRNMECLASPRNLRFKITLWTTLYVAEVIMCKEKKTVTKNIVNI